eukprot:Gb_41025 [translate_table: standard]
MKSEGNSVNALDSKIYADFASILKACSDVKQLRQAHALLLRSGIQQNVFLGTQLVIKYAERDRYAKNCPCVETLTLYQQLQQTGVHPDKFTFPCVLNACAGMSALQEGKEIHDDIVKGGFDSDVHVGAALVDMHAKCGSIEDAHNVFDKTSQSNVISWTAMIAGYGYAPNGHANEALSLFYQMQLAKVIPNLVTLTIVLLACAFLGALKQGKWIHEYIIRSGLELNVSVGTALIDMYAKCGSIEDARHLFGKMS